MNNLKKLTLIISLCIILTSGFTACSSNSSDSSSENSSTDAENSDVLEAYKKVELGMTKDQVDTALGLEAKADTSQFAIKGSYNYEDFDTGYGVSIIYNDKNLVFAKTAIYGSNSEIAYLCKKAVKEDQSDKITKDMAYTDVISILGGEGVECNLTGKETDVSVIGLIRRWANKDGSGIQVVFSKDDTVQNAMYFDHG